MLIANFTKRDEEIELEGLWQYDYGQKLQINGLDLPAVFEVHFAYKGLEKAIPQTGYTKDGVSVVDIPNSALAQPKTISAYIYLSDASQGETTNKILLYVNKRIAPEGFEAPEDVDLFHYTLEAVREYAERTAESEKSAESWAHGHEDYPDREEDNAAYYAGVAGENAGFAYDSMVETQRLAERVHSDADVTARNTVLAEQYKYQAAQSASDALQSERNAKASETAAQEAQAGAETAEGQAELFAEQVAADKTEVEIMKSDTKKMADQITKDKNAVQELADSFSLTHQQAVADVNNAGQAQTERVKEAGETAVDDIEVSRRQAVQSVKGEGETQVSNVQAAAEEIIADREQIAENKSGIAELKGDIDARIENIYLYGASSTINDIAIKTTRVNKSIIQNSWGYDLTSSNTIFNLLNAKIASSVQKTTNVIRVRDSDGWLIYNLDINDKASIPKELEAICMYVFDRLGNFLRNVRYNELKERNTPIIDDEYFVVLAEYPTVLPNNYWYVKRVEIEWLNKSIYKVGVNGDFKTLTSALKLLKDDTSEKTILIESGVYDIFAEMGGADYFNGLPTLQPTEWRTYCNLIPPNTKIIGVGYVVLLFNYTPTKNKDVFSCLNSSTGVYLENLNIIQNGGRYGIHLEGGSLSETIGNVYTIKNVNVKTLGSISGLGIGMNKNTLLNLDNCNVNSDGWAIFHHTNHHDNEHINISNCIVDGTLNLQNWGDDTNGNATVKTYIKNSYVKKLHICSVQSSVTVTDYDVSTFGINNDCDVTSQNVTPNIKNY